MEYGYLINYKDEDGTRKQHFCSDYELAFAFSEKLGGRYISISGNFPPSHFLKINHHQGN